MIRLLNCMHVTIKKYIIIWTSIHNCTIALVSFAALINAEINSKAPL